MLFAIILSAGVFCLSFGLFNLIVAGYWEEPLPIIKVCCFLMCFYI